MEQKVVKYAGNKKDLNGYYEVEITVQEATLRQGIERATLMSEQLTRLNATPEAGFLERMTAAATYPACLAVTVEVVNTGTLELDPKKLPLDEFYDLPDTMVNHWEAAVYKLNPDWNPFPQKEEEEETEEGEVVEPNSETSSPSV